MGLYWDNGEENGTYYSTMGILGLYWGNIWIMEKKIEPTIVQEEFSACSGVILG